MNSNIIKAFYVKGLWGEKDVLWEGIHPDMNILVGINGSGKTTLMNLMYAYWWDAKALGKIKYSKVNGIPDAGGLPVSEVVYVRNLDVPTRRKEESPLLQELESAVYQNKSVSSLMGYRIKMIDYPDRYDEIQNRIQQLHQLVNEMFAETGKRMVLRDGKLLFETPKGNVCQLQDLSSGEKQLLLILLRVFLLEEKFAVVFLDEPEISLHIGWQQQLLDTLTALNPNAQFFVTTHSPSMFGRGWGNKVIYMEDIVKPAE
jgi:ABC-type multidrug transport system ATPase subunit